MFGKGALIVVFGFILSFSVYQLKLNEAILSTSENFVFYYSKTKVHEAALSGMNIGINKVWAESITSANFTIEDNGCCSQVTIYENGLDTVMLKVKSWVHTFVEEYYNQHHTLYKLQDSVLAVFSYNQPISRYFWYTNYEGNVYWVSADTVWGPVHTNQILQTSGSPVFYGKVTAYRGISPNPTSRSNHAKYYGGWEIGIKVDIPTDMSHLLQAATTGNGSAPINTKCMYNQITTFEFVLDGSVIRTVGIDSADTVLISEIAPTNVIYSTEDVRVKGFLNGQLTIYSEKNIWIDDDLLYAQNPLTNPNSQNYLGLVGENNVYITDNAVNNDDVYIQACIMAVEGSFAAENYRTRPISGVLDVTGSIVQKNRGAVGTFGWWGIISGFSKRYRFDSRLASESPPSYPYVRSLSLVSWWE